MQTILIAGGTGLVGQRLSQLLQEKNYAVLHLSRKRNLDAAFPAYAWDLKKGYIEEKAIEQADYIINLAGAGVADQRWTESRKKLIISSRVESALLLKKYIEAGKAKSSVFSLPPRGPQFTPSGSTVRAYISASAIGFYGNRGDEWLRENDPPGETGFLPKSVVAWENAIKEIEATGVRTVAIRIGIVLSTQGGALEKMLLPFNFLTGAWFGDGRQWYSWIHIDDMCRMFIEAVENEKLAGIYNGVAPNPARNKDLTLTIKKALGKPALIMPAPAFALRTAMGELADAILDSTRVSSEKIEQAGFRFQFPELLPALRDLLDRKI